MKRLDKLFTVLQHDLDKDLERKIRLFSNLITYKLIHITRHKIDEMCKEGFERIRAEVEKLIDKANFSQLTLNDRTVKLSELSMSKLLPNNNEYPSIVVFTDLQEACIRLTLNVWTVLKISLLFVARYKTAIVVLLSIN